MRIDVYSYDMPQMEIMNDKFERNNVIVLQARSVETECDLMTNSLKETANLQRKGFIEVD